MSGRDSSKTLLLKLALRACERGDAEAAADALRGVLALPKSDRAPAPPASTRAVSVAKFASIVGYSARHVRTLLADGTVPPETVIGSGRGTRIIVQPALEALRRKKQKETPDSVQAEGAAFVKGRGRLRVVQGGVTDAREHDPAKETGHGGRQHRE